jgi:hypothetical protein
MGIPTANLGHEDQFGSPTLSARCRLGEGTFAGTRGQRARRADSGHSPDRDGTAGVDPEETFAATPRGASGGQEAAVRICR